MSPQKRSRSIQIKFYVTEHEYELIEQRMKQLGTSNREAFLRKMAIDGYILKLEMPELKEIVSLMRYSSNNLNQIAKRLNSHSPVHSEEIVDTLQDCRDAYKTLMRFVDRWEIRIGETEGNDDSENEGEQEPQGSD